MTLPRITLLATCISLAAGTGCSSSKPLASSNGAAGAGGAGTVAGQCTPPGYHVDTAPLQVDEVKAMLKDPSGAPVPNLQIQVCGTDTCTYATSAPKTGAIDAKPAVPLSLPAFKYGDGLDFAELAVPIRKSTQDLGDIVVLPLPAYADGAVFPKSGAVTNGDLTLFVTDETSVVHEVLNYQDDSQLVFRTVSIPIAQSQQALESTFELAYAVAPLGSTFCPPVRLSLKNTPNWDAGSEVEVFVQGVNTDEAWAPYGGWVKVADGSVSSDGSSIDTTSGGIPILSSIAVRRKQ
jgi:hypothetical protein